MSKVQDSVNTSTGVTKDDAAIATKEGYVIEGGLPPTPIGVCSDHTSCEHWKKLNGSNNKCPIDGCGRTKFKI